MSQNPILQLSPVSVLFAKMPGDMWGEAETKVLKFNTSASIVALPFSFGFFSPFVELIRVSWRILCFRGSWCCLGGEWKLQVH